MPGSTGRSDEIADAAMPVFLRFGLRKTSMDDLARAAGLSRQGLYLHFQTKQDLFHASLERLVSRAEAEVAEALAREDVPLQERVRDALTAVCGPAATTGSEVAIALLAVAGARGDSLLHDLERHVVDALTGALDRAGAPARHPGVSAEDLAHQLFAVASGVKHLTVVPPEDRDRHVRVAVRLLLGPPD
ncbi:TetR/AcrR family transcriptional regulator [Streptomyces parvulus]|uniref:TetR/AcrR family transcriptional regulator n=1 Tax=Streptomyces parvulus TaxID=146923 RepID=A0A369V156_9ACTN|nr:TetR/AcrR family transcriptional regulator [Streptomyces parvulus]RDD84299.1 TetR/AcrR family transcriptional regulator [Streptomyces parvulus]